jgi:hypothetical protein
MRTAGDASRFPTREHSRMILAHGAPACHRSRASCLAARCCRVEPNHSLNAARAVHRRAEFPEAVRPGPPERQHRRGGDTEDRGPRPARSAHSRNAACVSVFIRSFVPSTCSGSPQPSSRGEGWTGKKVCDAQRRRMEENRTRCGPPLASRQKRCRFNSVWWLSP